MKAQIEERETRTSARNDRVTERESRNGEREREREKEKEKEQSRVCVGGANQ